MIKNMKYFYRFKGLFFIALAISVAAQGSTVISSGPAYNLQNDEVSAVYNLSVSAEQPQNTPSSANLTMSGDNSKVSVEKGGTVTLVAGKSIILRPGTKISKGGFLYASIESKAKNGMHHKKVVKLVTVEEKRKIEEQACFATACEIFKPFPTPGRRYLHAGDADNGSFTLSNNDLMGVSPEQQRKGAVDSRQVALTAPKQLLSTINRMPETSGYRPETTRVLRL